MPLLVIAIVVQAVPRAFCVMAYRLTTGEEVAQENIAVALMHLRVRLKSNARHRAHDT